MEGEGRVLVEEERPVGADGVSTGENMRKGWSRTITGYAPGLKSGRIANGSRITHSGHPEVLCSTVRFQSKVCDLQRGRVRLTREQLEHGLYVRDVKHRRLANASQ